VKIENGKVRVGVTDHGQKQLTTITHVELPSPGEKTTQNEPYGTIESMKSVSELVAPLSGTIEEVNKEALDNPKIINKEPCGEGWLLVVSPTKLEEELKNLMTFEQAVEWHKSLPPPPAIYGWYQSRFSEDFGQNT